MNEPPDGPRPVFEYRRRDRRHWEVLDALFAAQGFGPREVLTNFPAYVRRRDLPRFLAHYELFKRIIDRPGSILDLGVYRGASFFTWTKLLETFCPTDRTRKVYGFDHFRGLVDFTEADGPKVDRTGAKDGADDAEPARWRAEAEHARTLVDLHNDDGLIAGVERCRLIEGDVAETLPRFLEETPGLRIGLLHLDLDLYAPTRAALDHLWARVVDGGVVIFDQYGLPPWEGETRAVDEFLSTLPAPAPSIRKFPFSALPGGYIVKGED